MNSMKALAFHLILWLLPVAPSLQDTNQAIRVAYLHFTLQAGGVERHIINLVKSIDPLKIEPTVVLFRQDASMALLPSIAPYARVVVFPASHLDAGSIVRERSGFASLVSFLRSFDVAFSFYLGGVDDLIGIDAAAMAGVPVSVAYVGWTVQVPRGLPIDALELPSEVLLNIQLQDGASEYKMERINSPLDLNVFDPSRFAVAGPGILPRIQSLVVGRISRLVAEKNPQTFILIAAYIKKTIKGQVTMIPEAVSPTTHAPLIILPRFVIAGSGPLRAELEALAREQDCSDMVEFVGDVEPDDVPRLLSTFDVFLYPTFGESFGYVVAEAMAMELPVVSTTIGSIPELVFNGSTGFLVSPLWKHAGLQMISEECIREYADYVLLLLRDAPLRKAMGKAGRAAVKARGVDSQTFAESHFELYERLLWDNITSIPSEPPALAALLSQDSSGVASAHINQLLPRSRRSRRDSSMWRELALNRVPTVNPDREEEETSLASRRARWWGRLNKIKEVPKLEEGYTSREHRRNADSRIGAYVINLDRSSQRLDRFLDGIEAHGLARQKVERVRAVDGLWFRQEETGSNDERVRLAYRPTFEDTDEHHGESFAVTFVDFAPYSSRLQWSPGNVAVTLSHLKAIRIAFDRGDEVSLILEDDSQPHSPFDSNNKIELEHVSEEFSHGGLDDVLAAADEAHDWTIIQLGYIPDTDTDGLDRLAVAWRQGILLVPRLACSADWRIFGLHAYLVHRRGMKLLLDAWWPGGHSAACVNSRGDTCDMTGLDIDLTLAGRIYSESVILNIPGVYTVTRPLFSQLYGVSDTGHKYANRHEFFQANALVRLREVFTTRTEPGDASSFLAESNKAYGVELSPPPIDSAQPGLNVFLWLAHSDAFVLTDSDTRPRQNDESSTWLMPGFCEPMQGLPNSTLSLFERSYCSFVAFSARTIRNVCYASGFRRPSSNNLSRGYLPSALASGENTAIIFYVIDGQVQAATFFERDINGIQLDGDPANPESWKPGLLDLASNYCLNEAQLPKEACDRMASGFSDILFSFKWRFQPLCWKTKSLPLFARFPPGSYDYLNAFCTDPRHVRYCRGYSPEA